VQPPGSRIYEVRSETRSGKFAARGARRDRADAELLLDEVRARPGAGQSRHWIEVIDTTGLFDIPTQPSPRDRYTARVEKVDRGPGIWPGAHVELLDGDQVVFSYERNYSMLQTFEPFRQGDHHYALISPEYTATTVVNLDSGQIIAGEEPSAGGFCPVGFYVPDWWDLHDGSILPGSTHWRPDDHEWPDGTIGFVWGCVWGDDSSWKVQCLDLARISDGELRRDDRFGYLPLATHHELRPRQFIRCSSWMGRRRVAFDVEEAHYLDDGSVIPSEDI
jgi:hypothetical protein